MYCTDCDYRFTPTARGLVPDHWGKGRTWINLTQKKCPASGETAARGGMRSPRNGDSQKMTCTACPKRVDRVRAGRLTTHPGPDGRPCSGHPTGSLRDQP